MALALISMGRWKKVLILESINQLDHQYSQEDDYRAPHFSTVKLQMAFNQLATQANLQFVVVLSTKVPFVDCCRGNSTKSVASFFAL